MPERVETRSGATWLIDGFNVLHAVLLGGEDRAAFWKEAQRARLLERLTRFDDPTAHLTVVFDGHREPSPEAERPSPSVRVVFAPSADDWIVQRVRETQTETELCVVTNDRKVAGRCRHRGAEIVSPLDLMARCPSPGTGTGEDDDV